MRTAIRFDLSPSSNNSRYADCPQLFSKTHLSQRQQDFRHIAIGLLFVLGPAAVVLLVFKIGGAW